MSDKQQLNIRLSPETDAVLRTVAYLSSRSAGDLARELLEQALDDYAEQTSVKKALEARAEHGAELEGKLARLPPGDLRQEGG